MGKQITATVVDSKQIAAKILDAILVRSGTDDVNSIKFNFTNADLVNGILTKYHGLNSIVDVTVSNGVTEVEVTVNFDNLNQVSLDLTRIVPLVGTWTVLIEK